MNPWMTFWTALLLLGLTVFAVLTVVVAIGGFRDLRAMFRRIASQHAADPTGEPSTASEQRGEEPIE